MRRKNVITIVFANTYLGKYTSLSGARIDFCLFQGKQSLELTKDAVLQGVKVISNFRKDFFQHGQLHILIISLNGESNHLNLFIYHQNNTRPG